MIYFMTCCIREVARSMAGTVNDRSNTGITISNPTLDMDLHVRCLQCVSSCAGTEALGAEEPSNG